MTGTFAFDQIKGRPLVWPPAKTPCHWIMIGLDRDLDQAMRVAIRETIGFLADEEA